MIRHATNRWYHGKRVNPGDIVKGSDKQKEVLLSCGQAYDDGLEVEPKPDMSNTKAEIIEYLNAHYIEHSENSTKAELLELI
jgi:hypothetical protein